MAGPRRMALFESHFVGSRLVKPFADVFKAFRKASERDFKVSNGYNEWYID